MSDVVDVVIVGGGVIGLTIAWELAGQGVRVAVLDKSETGTEASWAGAGMIPPGDLSPVPGAHELAVLSTQLWPRLSSQLLEETGIENGYRSCGAVRFATAHSSVQEAELWRQRGVPVEVLDAASLRELVPGINSEAVPEGVFLPTFAQVRNPRHVRALRAAGEKQGVRYLTNSPVSGWRRSGSRIVAAITPNGEISADRFVVAAGAWSAQLLESVGVSLHIRPVRGQMLLLSAGRPLFTQVLDAGLRYIVPRDDGRVLVGATEEDAGFEKANTREAVEQLRAFADRTVPGLRGAELERAWSGLRPCSPLGRPVISPASDCENLFIATGHFRAGLSSSPATGLLARQLMLGQSPALSPGWFAAPG